MQVSERGRKEMQRMLKQMGENTKIGRREAGTWSQLLEEGKHYS